MIDKKFHPFYFNKYILILFLNILQGFEANTITVASKQLRIELDKLSSCIEDDEKRAVRILIKYKSKLIFFLSLFCF